MWYVIQTLTGGEEELIGMIWARLRPELYRDCFVIKAEWMKRLGGKWQIQVKPLFQGYIFIDTDQPEAVFLGLKEVPRFSRLLGSGRSEFRALEGEETEFLKMLLGKEKNVIRLTEVHLYGPSYAIEEKFDFIRKKICKVNLHRRYILIRLKMCGVEKTIKLGIRLIRDEKRPNHEEEERYVIFNCSGTSG